MSVYFFTKTKGEVKAIKKILKRLATGFLAFTTIATALPTTAVHASEKQYWTESGERSMFHPVPGYRFETAQRANVRVNAFSAARFRMNSYFVPVQYTGRIVGVKGDPEPVALRQLSPDTDIGEILLSLMKTEYEQR